MKLPNILRRRAAALIAVTIMTGAQAWAGIMNQLPTIRVNGTILYYYDTQSGDNIYTIADKLGVSVEEIRANNPSVADGIKPRMRLFFPSDISTTSKGDSQGPLSHVVAKGESIYGIARRYGLSMDELVTLNPAAKEGIKPGMRLKLREDTTGDVSGDVSEEVTVNTTAIAPASPAPDSLADTTVVTPPVEEMPATGQTEEMHLAVILPFLLEEENIGRQTKLYTEFYKGFLLAADTLNLPGRVPVKIHAYDTAANLDSVRAIMRRPEMATMDLIVGPDNLTHLETIAASAPAGAMVMNMFAVRDSSYATMPGMVQANIPHDRMYSQAIEGFLDRFPDATPVFLTRMGGRADKEEFTAMLKERLSSVGRIYRTVNFDGYLADADLEEFDPATSSYVFIPASGSRDEFTRILHALKDFKAKAILPDAVQVFGYPEWATFRGEQFDDICDLSTTIYSRYAPVEKDPDAMRVNEAFRRAYGEGMLDKQMPVLGILGFDTGRMAMEGLRTKAETGVFPSEYTGIQSGLSLEKAGEEGGLCNDALFIITYRPGGFIEKSLK